MLSTSFYGFLIVFVSVVIALAGLLVVQRLIPLSTRERHNAATGAIYAALYVMFGVTMSFTLYLVWQQFNTARQVTDTEAASVEQIYHLAGGLPDPQRSRVQELSASYAKGVAEDEWPLMEQGKSSPRLETLLDELRQNVQGFDPNTEAENVLYAEALAELDELEENREFRLLAINEGIPSILWVVLVVGGTLTITFAYLFGMKSAQLHAATVAGLTVLVSLILHAIGVLDYPFNGGVGVPPDAFERVMHEIGDKGGL